LRRAANRRTDSARVDRDQTLPGARATASRRLPGATMNASMERLMPAATAGSTPLTARTVPDSSSSPRARIRQGISGIWDEDASIARAMDRSKDDPPFLRPAGARLMRRRSRGNSNPEFRTAARIRSRASFMAPSGNPTISTLGIPRRRSTSTVTSSPSNPTLSKAYSCMA